MTKSGWWNVSFEITLEGEEIRWEDLSECSREHILYCVMNGYTQGEIVEETNEDKED